METWVSFQGNRGWLLYCSHVLMYIADHKVCNRLDTTRVLGIERPSRVIVDDVVG